MKLKRWEWLIIAGLIAVMFGIAYAVDEKITVSYTAKSLTAASYTNATRAIISVSGNDIKFTTDGVTVPTSGGVGVVLKKDLVYTDILISNTAIKNFKAVRASDTDAVINISYQWPQRL